MFFINFLKSLVLPSYMVRYRSMNIFFAIAIFFIGAFALAIPQTYVISKERYEIVDHQNPYSLQVFQHLEEEDLQILRDTKLELIEGILHKNDNVLEHTPYISYVDNEGSNDLIYIGFDFYNRYDPDESPNKELTEDFTKLPKREDGDNIMLIFYIDYVIYQYPGDVRILSYHNTNLEFSNIVDGTEISYLIMDMFVPIINQQISFDAFINCVVYTLLIILVLWLFFKISGYKFTFKENYNIASIAAIIPLVVVFIVSWMIPSFNLMMYYSSIFGIYFLIMMLVINSKTKIA